MNETELYTLLREFADSWVLLALFTFFLGVGAWAFWPALGKDREDARQIPFRDDDITGPKAVRVKEKTDGRR